MFLFFYYGTEYIIALSSPGGHYSAFISDNLDYVSFIKRSLISGTRFLLSIFQIDTYQLDPFIVRIKNGLGVRIAHGCVGYGVFSFWLAYVLANRYTIKHKALLAIVGLFVLWLINVIRISLLLVAIQNKWPMPLGWDHHTWFTIISYGAILIFLFLSEKKQTGIFHK